MENKNTAPQDQGAEKRSLKDLFEMRGISPYKVSILMDLETSEVSKWIDGKKVPNALQCINLSQIVDIPLKEIYAVVLNT